MRFTEVDTMSEDQADAIAGELLAAHAAGKTIPMPNPHYQGLRIADRFLAPIAARAAREGTTPQALVDQAIENYLERNIA